MNHPPPARSAPLLADDGLLEAVERDFESSSLDERRKQMLRYATKLTLSPAEMLKTDVAALCDAGFADADILAIAEVVGYYAYVNRVADGLGVELE